MKNKVIKSFFIVIFFLILLFIYQEFFKKEKLENTTSTIINEQEKVYNSNIIKDVRYTTKDKDGNEYTIKASKGEIDFSDPNIIYLTDVNGLIRLKSSEDIIIESNFGKYNTDNFDTIFSKNVIVRYLENKIEGNYLDFSLKRNSMIISKNVIYTNLKNILKADVVDINIKTKDTKIFMYEKEKKVKIKSKNINGNN